MSPPWCYCGVMGISIVWPLRIGCTTKSQYTLGMDVHRYFFAATPAMSYCIVHSTVG